MPTAREPRLLADIGAQHARFAIEREPGVLDQQRMLNCDEYPDFVSALRAYLSQVTPESVRAWCGMAPSRFPTRWPAMWFA